MRVPAALEQWAVEHNDQLSRETVAEVKTIAAAIAASAVGDKSITDLDIDLDALSTIFDGQRIERAATLIDVVAKWAAKRPVNRVAPPTITTPIVAPSVTIPSAVPPTISTVPAATRAVLAMQPPAATPIAAPAFLRSDKVDEDDDHRLYGPRRPWKAIIIALVTLVALAGAAAGGYYWFTQRDTAASSDPSDSEVVAADPRATSDAATPQASPEPSPTATPEVPPQGYWADIVPILNTGSSKIEASTYVVSPSNRAVLTGHTAAITGIAISDDGRVLTSGADSRLVDWGADVTLASPDVLNVPSPLTVLIRTVDQRVVAGDTDGSITIIDLVNAVDPILLPVHDVAVSSIAELADGRFAVASVDGVVAVFAVDTPEDRTLLTHSAEVTAVVALPDGSIATASVDGIVRLWAPDGAGEPGEISTLQAPVTALVLLDDGQLAAASVDGAIHIFAPTAGATETQVLPGHIGAVRVLYGTTIGGMRVLASGGDDTTVRLWSLDDATQIRVLEGHGDIISGIGELPDGRLVTTSGDGTGRVWDLTIAAGPSVVPPHDWNLSALALIGNDQFVSGGIDGKVVLGSTAETSQPQLVSQHDAPIVGLAVDENGNAVSLDATGVLRITDLTGQAVAPERTLAAGATSLALRGNLGIVVGYADGTVRFDDFSTEVSVVEAHGSAVTDVAVLSDGTVLSAGQDKTVRIIDLDNPDEVRVFDLHTAPVDLIVELADGRIASAGSDGIFVWSLDTLTDDVIRLTGHRSRTLSLVSVSDNQLLSSGDDGRVRLWDLTTPDAEGTTLIDIPGIVNPYLIRAGNGSYVAGAARGYVVFGLPQ